MLAPFFWAHVNPVIIYNSALFAAFALSGGAAFLLGRQLTGSLAGGMAAGAIYAFAPNRFTHYMHLELQGVLGAACSAAGASIIASGSLRDGAWLGLTAAAQLLSCVDVTLFSLAYFAFVVPALMIAAGVRDARRLFLPMAVAAAVLAPIAVPYALAYLSAERSVGARGLGDVTRYSASGANYLSAPAINRLYGRTAVTDPILADEMNLFPGVVAVALAVLGVSQEKAAPGSPTSPGWRWLLK